MKKSLLLASALALVVSTPCFAQDNAVQTLPAKDKIKIEVPADVQKKLDAKRQQGFDARLKLTDEQKAKAKEMREQRHKEMEPIVKSLQAKEQKIKDIKEASLSNKEKKEIEKLQGEIQALKKQLHEQRMQNMKDFESILTESQKQELNKIKEEGRKNFQKNHGPRPGYQKPVQMPVKK